MRDPNELPSVAELIAFGLLGLACIVLFIMLTKAIIERAGL